MVTSMNSYSRGLAAAEALRRPPGASVSSSSRAAGMSSGGLQARQEARERPCGFGGAGNYGSNALLRGGEHPAGGGEREHDRDAFKSDQDKMRVPRPDNLLRHRTDPTHDSGGRQFVFPALASAASQSREGADERGPVSAADASLPRRRRGGAGTPPAYPPPPAHLPSPPPPLIPSYHYSGGAGGSGGSGNAAHGAAGSRSLPPGRGNRPTTPSSQVGGAHAGRRGGDERGAATGLSPGGAGPLGNPAFEGRDPLPGRGAAEASSRSRSVAAPGGSAGSAGGSSSSTDKCDKCDGKHPTDQCPHFRGDREKHKDAWVNYGQRIGPKQMGGNGGNFVLKSARVVRQPGDGSCLFHSLAHGLPTPSSASCLRREISGFLSQNPSLEIAGDTLEEWVRWDSNSSVAEYARRMSVSGWGGGIEMAACSLLKHVNVHVYENLCRSSRSCSSEFKRISCFDSPNATRTVHVLYQGGVHYDALVPLVAT